MDVDLIREKARSGFFNGHVTPLRDSSLDRRTYVRIEHMFL